MSPKSRADCQRDYARRRARRGKEWQLDLERVLRQMRIGVGREEGAQGRDPGRQVVVYRDLAEGSSPGTAGPDADASSRGLMISAGQHDGRRPHLPCQCPAQRCHGARVDQTGMRHQQPQHCRGHELRRFGRSPCRGHQLLDHGPESGRVRRVEASGHGRSPGLAAHWTAAAASKSTRPTPARARPQRTHRPSASPARDARNPRRRIRVAPHPAQHVSWSPSSTLPE